MRTARSPLLVLLTTLALLVAACGSAASDDGTAASDDGTAAATSTTADVASPAPAAEIGSIVALGDSIMAWNVDLGASIPDVIGESLGAPVVNASVGGAFAGDVVEQYDEAGGDHDWVVLDGGGNDYNDRCGCGECATVADTIVTSDGQGGVLADFTESLVAEGRNVVLVGYYELPEGAAFGFARCGEELVEHTERMRTLAGRFDSVLFVDPGEIVQGDDRFAFDDDLVHPSIEGSRVVGEQIAAAISAAG
ncbi:MAG: SGNH/GDSL hydrolase family protein [Actinomycetota bacterium]